MNRFLVVWLPAFRLERCGCTAEEVAGLLGEVKNAVRLVAVTPMATALGLRVGMTAAEARALVPEVALSELDGPGELEDRRALIRALGELSDRVAFFDEEAVVVDLSRTSKLHGGEDRAARRALALATGFGHRALVAVADDPLAARAIAGSLPPDAPVRVVPPGEGRSALAALPFGSLVPEPALAAALRTVGVSTIGAFAALDPASVVGRYGPGAARLHRVARGAADVTGARIEVGGGELPTVRTAMAGATTRAELAFALPGLLAVLCERLGELDLAVVRLSIVLVRSSEPRTAVSVRAGRPTRSARALDRLIRSRLDRLDAGPSEEAPTPIEELVLEVEEAAPEVGWQPGLSDRSESGEPLPDLLSRLADQLGDAAVFSPVLQDTWRPEAAWAPGVFPRWTLDAAPAKADDPVARLEAREQGLPRPRPTCLLPRPQPIDVDCADDGTPTRVRLDTSWRPLTRCAGPERLWGEWWTRAPLDREYWAAEVDGRAAWIFRDDAGWALHGWFD